MSERERIRSGINVCLGILGILGGLLGGMFQAIWLDRGALLFWFLLAFVASGGCFFLALVQLVKSYHGHTYAFMPTALECKKYRDSLREYYASYFDNPTGATNDFNDFLEVKYAAAADYNAKVNAVRSGHLYSANTATIWCGIFTLIAFVPLSIHRLFQAQSIQ